MSGRLHANSRSKKRMVQNFSCLQSNLPPCPKTIFRISYNTALEAHCVNLPHSHTISKQLKGPIVQCLKDTLGIILPGDVSHLGQAFAAAIVLEWLLPSPCIIYVDVGVIEVCGFCGVLNFVDKVCEKVVEVGIVGFKFIGRGS